MTKHKHNKKRNTAFLFEVLLQEIAKTSYEKKNELREKLIALLKESFAPGTILNKELRLYKEILDTEGLDELSAEKVLLEVKRQREKLDLEKLFESQTVFQGRLRKLVGEEVFSNFVPNFKSLATIAQIFNANVPVKSRVLLESNIVKKMASKLEEKNMIPVDNLVLKSFITRFNEKYTETLQEEQKKLLNKFIMSFSDNGADLKVFLNKEVGRLKKELNESLNIDEFKTDPQMLKGAKEVISLLEGYKDIEIGPEIIGEVLKVQNLLREIKK